MSNTPSTPEQTRVALWDIDGTMSRRITHFKVVERLAALGRFRKEMATETKGYLVKYQAAKRDHREDDYPYEVFINDLLTSFAMGLQGQSSEEVQELVSGFFEDNKNKMFYPYVKPTIEDLGKIGVKSVIVTGNTQFTSSAVGDLFGIKDDVISSVVEVKDGLITGNVTALAYSQEKLDAINKRLAELAIEGALKVYAAFGDSVADKDMLELAERGRRFCISPDGTTPNGLQVVKGLVVPSPEELDRYAPLFNMAPR